MPQQDLHDADVLALFEELGGEAVAKGVGRERIVEATRGPSGVEGESGGGRGQMRSPLAVGEEPLGVAMDLPDLAEHEQDGHGQGQGPLSVAFADDPQEHPLGVDRGNGQGDGFADPQAAGVDQGETAAVDRLVEGGDQTAAVLVAADVGQAPAQGWADFFFVSSGQS